MKKMNIFYVDVSPNDIWTYLYALLGSTDIFYSRMALGVQNSTVQIKALRLCKLVEVYKRGVFMYEE